MYTVLLVDDEIDILTDRSKLIEGLGFKCLIAQDGREAIRIVKHKNPDVVLTDMKMPDNDGFEVLKKTKEIDATIPVIVFTAYGTIESAVRAMKLGADDFLQKPIAPEIMEIVLKKAIEYKKIKNENIILRSHIQDTYKLKNIIGTSEVMQAITDRLLRVAQTDASVLIYGESGTGKELIARNIHLNSRRKDKAFIPLDCVALPATLLESEVFGFEKGAFTNANKLKPGVIELANGGTLFLDEIVELDLNLQAKLLRVLQEHQFRRIGGTKTITVDVRVISATNWNPQKAVDEKKLRQDLYFRLNVVPLFLPPLRDRKDDIPLLVNHFIKVYNPSCQRNIQGITSDAMKCLKNYHWPGNIRELQNTIERIMSLTDQEIINYEDLPENIREYDLKLADAHYLNMNYKEAKEKYLNQFLKKYFDKLFKKYRGNVTKVARSAGISRRTLYRLMENMSEHDNLQNRYKCKQIDTKILIINN